MNTKCSDNCFMWLFLNVCFCSAPTKDFFLIPYISPHFGLCHTAAILLGTMRHSQGSLYHSHMLNAYPALPTMEKNLDLRSLIKYYNITPWCFWQGARLNHPLYQDVKWEHHFFLLTAQDVGSATINRLPIRMKNTHQKKKNLWTIQYEVSLVQHFLTSVSSTL